MPENVENVTIEHRSIRVTVRLLYSIIATVIISTSFIVHTFYSAMDEVKLNQATTNVKIEDHAKRIDKLEDKIYGTNINRMALDNSKITFTKPLIQCLK